MKMDAFDVVFGLRDCRSCIFTFAGQVRRYPGWVFLPPAVFAPPPLAALCSSVSSSLSWILLAPPCSGLGLAWFCLGLLWPVPGSVSARSVAWVFACPVLGVALSRVAGAFLVFALVRAWWSFGVSAGWLVACAWPVLLDHWRCRFPKESIVSCVPPSAVGRSCWVRRACPLVLLAWVDRLASSF